MAWLAPPLPQSFAAEGAQLRVRQSPSPLGANVRNVSLVVTSVSFPAGIKVSGRRDFRICFALVRSSWVQSIRDEEWGSCTHKTEEASWALAWYSFPSASLLGTQCDQLSQTPASWTSPSEILGKAPLTVDSTKFTVFYGEELTKSSHIVTCFITENRHRT